MSISNDTQQQYFINHLYIKDSVIHGRGVFAGQLFNKNDVLEIFPLTPMAFRTRYQGDIGVLTYSFINTKCPCEECKKHGHVIYLGMGYSSAYNHQDTPNAEILLDFGKLTGTIKALTNIEKDSEIYIKYEHDHPFLDGKVMLHD